MKLTENTGKQSRDAASANAAKVGGKGISQAAIPAFQYKESENADGLQTLLTTDMPVQKRGLAYQSRPAFQLKPNNTGMPDKLKAGVENLSGMDLSDVKVSYNSDKPAQLNALAYAQGNDIHIAPGQEKHLPHEAWHVVQQRQGRVQATTQLKQGVAANDDTETDVMALQAIQLQRQNNLIFQFTGFKPGKAQVLQYRSSPTINYNRSGVSKPFGPLVVQRNSVGDFFRWLCSCLPCCRPAAEAEDRLVDNEAGYGTFDSNDVAPIQRPQTYDQIIDRLIGEAMQNVPRGRELAAQVVRKQLLNKQGTLKNLVAGINYTDGDGLKIRKLMDNLAGCGFRYNGRAHGKDSFFSGTFVGDCQTLSTVMVEVLTTILNVPAQLGSKLDRFQVNSAKRAIGPTDPNQGDHWVFDNHYWVIANGTNYDPLFNEILDNSAWKDL